MPVGQVMNGSNHLHIACRSKPHRTVEDFKMVRQQFDEWRQTNSLRTMNDWNSWLAFRARKTLKAKGVTSGHGDLEGQCKRQFLRAFANNDDGLKDCTYTELASWLTGIGYPTTADDVKNAKRSKAALTDWSLVNDAQVKALLDAIGVRYGWSKV